VSGLHDNILIFIIFHVQVSQLMDRFEQSFENLDVQSQVMENTMCNTSTLTTPQGQVDSLMQEVADEAGYVYSTFFFF
jgi:division protein CdvB (Snf7/Vps24/ESCRT-III family)